LLLALSAALEEAPPRLELEGYSVPGGVGYELAAETADVLTREDTGGVCDSDESNNRDAGPPSEPGVFTPVLVGRGGGGGGGAFASPALSLSLSTASASHG